MSGDGVPAVVPAAGGVVLRPGSGGLEIVAVHRPRYDDWSLPKGKLAAGEDDRRAALREVREETGLRCRTVAELPSVEYRDRHGRPKRVRYWLMRVVGGDIGQRAPDPEVDRVRWLDPREASRLLTYPRDRELVGTALRRAAALGLTSG